MKDRGQHHLKLWTIQSRHIQIAYLDACLTNKLYTKTLNWLCHNPKLNLPVEFTIRIYISTSTCSVTYYYYYVKMSFQTKFCPKRVPKWYSWQYVYHWISNQILLNKIYQ